METLDTLDALDKQTIDNMSMVGMLRMWRFSDSNNILLQGAAGKYFAHRMYMLRDTNPQDWVHASKMLGF